MKRNRYIMACLFFFIAGAYLWKIKSDGLGRLVISSDDGTRTASSSDGKQNPILFEIDKEVITKEDIEWEYQLILRELKIESFGQKGATNSLLSTSEAIPLKKKLASALIERKVLYSAIRRDESFNVGDPNRYVSCLTQWKELLDRTQSEDQTDRLRLKNRLCERSLLDQYMAERLFKDVKVQDADIENYYKSFRSQFRQFESVGIKHILFVDEPTAKRWRSALTVENFSDMARAHSITPEGKTGGRLGPYVKGMLPAVFDGAFHMKVGEISDILRSNYGYHVILLEEKNEKRQLDLAKARPEIIKILVKKKREMIYDTWLEQALASVRVTAPKSTF